MYETRPLTSLYARSIPSVGAEPCIYIIAESDLCVLVLVYVDDVLVTGRSLELIARTKNDLNTRFEMIDSDYCA